MSHPIRMIALAALAVSMFPSCETVQTETWSEIRSEDDKLYDRFVGQSLDREEEGKMHSMDRQRTDTTKLFGGTHENEQFGKGEFKGKRFAGGKKFSGNKEFDANNYQFVRDRERAREEAAVASKRFAGQDQTAGEGSKRWFGRNKKIARERATGTDGAIDRPELREARISQDREHHSQIEVLNPVGHQAAPKAMSIEEMRKLMGR